MTNNGLFQKDKLIPFPIQSSWYYLFLFVYDYSNTLYQWFWTGGPLEDAEGVFEYDVVSNHCPLLILITTLFYLNYLSKAWTRPQLCDK